MTDSFWVGDSGEVWTCASLNASVGMRLICLLFSLYKCENGGNSIFKQDVQLGVYLDHQVLLFRAASQLSDLQHWTGAWEYFSMVAELTLFKKILCRFLWPGKVLWLHQPFLWALYHPQTCKECPQTQRSLQRHWTVIVPAPSPEARFLWPAPSWSVCCKAWPLQRSISASFQYLLMSASLVCTPSFCGKWCQKPS